MSIELLESRELLSSTVTVDTFDNDAPRSTPSGWVQWSNETQPGFQVVNGAGFGSNNALVTSGDSNLASRTWLTSAYAKDAQVQADIYLNSPAPIELFARGANLATPTPTYYAVSVSRGMEVDLLQVNDGRTTVLATVVSSAYFSNKWVRVNFAVQGDELTVQVFRTDTAQYLGPDDLWHSVPTTAISMTDRVISNAGRVGLARESGYAGTIDADNFVYNSSPSITTPTSLLTQDFNSKLVSGLPADWSSYTNIRNQTFQVSASSTALTGASLASVTGSSGLVARTWANTVLPADVQVSASLYLNNLAPAQVFGRGQNLDTDSPDYYAVSITRGATVQLVRVVDGGDNGSRHRHHRRLAQRTMGTGNAFHRRNLVTGTNISGRLRLIPDVRR